MLTIQNKRATAARLTTVNPVLAEGEEVFETDTGKYKTGNGILAWNALPYASGGASSFINTLTPLDRWQRKLATSGSTAKIAINGDSTSESISAAGYMYHRLKTGHTLKGAALEPLAGDYFTDGVTTSGSPVLTSATANFTTADVGKAIFPSNVTQFGVPTAILSRQSATQVTLTQNALATATGVGFSLERRIVGLGYSGLTLSGWLSDTAKKNALIAEAPDLIIGSWLLNDVRLGQVTLTQAIAMLKQYVEFIQVSLPNADILLRMPNPMLSTNVGPFNYVQTSGGVINPAGLAQTYSTLIRNAYLALAGLYEHVDILDTHAEIFGTLVRGTHPLIADQLHPSPGYSGAGYYHLADAIAARIGVHHNAKTPLLVDSRSYAVSKSFVCNGGGVGFIDVFAGPGDAIESSQFPLTNAFSLLVAGMDDPIPLTSANVIRPFAAGIRITSLPAPASTVDFNGWVGRQIVAVATNPKLVPTTGDRNIVSVDLASIAAGATVTATVTVTGASPGLNSVVVSPPTAFVTAGLIFVNAYPSGADTVTIVITNPTGAAIDRPAENWTFWVVR